MNIQLNTDNNLTLKEEYADKLNAILNNEFDRFSEFLTRIEVHLSDENGHKKSSDDKKCMLEARLKGRQPAAVSAFGNTYDMAVSGAINKLKASLDTITGKIKQH